MRSKIHQQALYKALCVLYLSKPGRAFRLCSRVMRYNHGIRFFQAGLKVSAMVYTIYLLAD